MLSIYERNLVKSVVVSRIELWKSYLSVDSVSLFLATWPMSDHIYETRVYRKQQLRRLPMARRYGIRTETGSDSGQVPWPERTCTTMPPRSIHVHVGTIPHARIRKRREHTTGRTAYRERLLCKIKPQTVQKWYREIITTSFFLRLKFSAEWLQRFTLS